MGTCLYEECYSKVPRWVPTCMRNAAVKCPGGYLPVWECCSEVTRWVPVCMRNATVRCPGGYLPV